MVHSLFETCQEFLEPEGALRDIYIFNSTIEDWQIALELALRYPNYKFSIDGNSSTIPHSVQQILDMRPDSGPHMNFNVHGIDIACHFFDSSEIEFDFLPNEVKSCEQFDALMSFVQQLGQAIKKQVAITYENCRKSPSIIFDPRTNEFKII